jgi:DNA-binding GntR family transcriptional regulator
VITMTERDDGPRFDPRGPHLVYMLIADDIAAQISRGELVPGQRLPGEADLAAHYGAARMTIRRAIRELRERGLVKVLSGKGTYVTPDDEKPSQA